MSRADHPEWAIRCPWCHAPPGTRCTTPTGRPITIPSHDTRTTAWTTQQADQTGDTR
ncbi:hypothetical protein [Streptomyces sp. NPDC056188]|uniref:zinc finger domain-containing protein n=1 Tax=Streptomyces sp. NPDC056188 TaxID=3345740 RepID=UPI0035DBA75E